MIYQSLKKNQYLYPINSQIKNLETYQENIDIPLVVDTEFTGNKRIGVTVQVKSIHEKVGKIFAHKDLVEYANANNLTLRHPCIEDEFAPITYVRNQGYDIELIRKNDVRKKNINGKVLPVCTFSIYAHFALAELFLICDGGFREELVKTHLDDKYRNIEMTRRLSTCTRSPKGNPASDSIELPYHMKLEGKVFRIRLKIIDTCALHGIASYKNLAEATGVKLKYKESLTKEELEDMLGTYFNKPQKYDKYALGDLEVGTILYNNAKLFKNVYTSLGLGDYYEPPELTIGATVKKLFEAALHKELNISNIDEASKTLLEEILEYGSSSKLKKYVDTNRCLLAKVFGGRCRNNKPLETHTKGIIADNDLSGAYGEALRGQIYPIGKPVIEDFAWSRNNRYFTLRQWLKQRKYKKKNCELVYGLWTAIVSTKEINRDKNQWETLNYEQDFLASWFNFKFDEVKSMRSDTEVVDREIAPKTGSVKILNNQIVQAVITSEFLEWLYNVCDSKQRDELLDNLYVNVACYYPAQSRLETFEELKDLINQWGEKNTTEAKRIEVKHQGKTINTTKTVKTTIEPTAWIGINLGELIVNDLLAWRKMHKALDGKKSPMDVLFKLCTNTLYGDFTSPFFNIGNTVVGNNITARCRAMAWYMEKGHHAYQSITDGGQIDLNTICYPRNNRRLTASKLTNLHREKDPSGKRNIILKPLAEYDSIEEIRNNDPTNPVSLKLSKDGKTTILDDPKPWLQEELMKHLRQIFPKVSVLHKETEKLVVCWDERKVPIKSYEKQTGMYSFEIKSLYTEASFHGTSNYLLRNNHIEDGQADNLAMRSYEAKKEHLAYDIMKNGELQEIEFYSEVSPSRFFLEQLRHSDSIKRSKSFVKKGILKLNSWTRNYDKWHDKNFFCGDTIEKVGLFREFSLSQFTYRSIDQYIAIEKEVQKNKRRYNQSYEGYFINLDGTLDYDNMIRFVDMAIATSTHSINKLVDKNRHRNRNGQISHPEMEVYKILKARINCPEKDIESSVEDEIGWDDDWNLEELPLKVTAEIEL